MKSDTPKKNNPEIEPIKVPSPPPNKPEVEPIPHKEKPIPPLPEIKPTSSPEISPEKKS